jgi:hypothetical protein
VKKIKSTTPPPCEFCLVDLFHTTVLPAPGGLDEDTGEAFPDEWLCIQCGHMWPMADDPRRRLN